jgi:hypothetical protein
MRTRKSPLPPEEPGKRERREKPLSWRGLERILRGLVVSQYPPLKAMPDEGYPQPASSDFL